MRRCILEERKNMKTVKYYNKHEKYSQIYTTKNI